MSSQAVPESRVEPTVDVGLDRAGLVAAHRTLLLARILDERLVEASKQGALESWAPGSADAALIGATSVLADRDWLFAGPHDLAAALCRGVSLDVVLAHVFATSADPTKARALPQRLSLRGAPAIAGTGTRNGAHLTHAAGVAWAAKIRHEDAIALAFFDGDEIASAEFHNALNFAGVFRLPVLFVACRAATMTAGESAKSRGVAYGVPTSECDGDDVLAVARSVGEAATRARAGEGATLIEVTTAEKALGASLSRYERDLAKRGVDTSALVTPDAIRAEVDEAIARARESLRGAGQSPETMFDDVYGTLPWHLAEERDVMRHGRR